MRFSIITRLTLVFSLLVLATALMMYYGVELRTERVREAHSSESMSFIVDSISFGIRNYVVTADSDLIGQVVGEVLNKTIDPEIVVTSVLVKNIDGETVYEFKNPPAEHAQIYPVETEIIHENRDTGDKTPIGSIRLEYFARDPADSEKTRQVITIGHTIGSMFQVFYRNKTLFQAKELLDTMKQDPNIVYCRITGKNNEEHFRYPEQENPLQDRITQEHVRRALSVNHATPLVIQDITETARYGKVIEVSILIEQGEDKLGVVRIGYAMKDWTRKIGRTRQNVTLIIVGFTLLAMALSWYLSRSVARPLTRLSDVARSVAAEAPRRDIDITDAEEDIQKLEASFEAIATRLRTRRDEVGDLAESFSRMIRSLRHRVRELKQFYQKMGQADRLFAMGQLSAGIAHEINNPLAIISTYVQLMEKRSDLDEELQKEIRIMSEEIQRIAGKVSDLLSFAQDSEVRFAQADVHDLVRRTLSLVRHRLEKRNIKMVLDFCSEEPLYAEIDANKIKQVVLNLGLNAMQAMDEQGGTLTLSTQMDEDTREVLLHVSDTGCGIAEPDLPHIFDPFFTRRRTGEGTGLGLAISYSIVQAHRGDITVRSEPGQGATFTVRLPSAPEA